MAEVSIREVKKSFGRTDVLHGVSVDIADGEMMVILGPSGCGKSTLLRLVAGLETIGAGEIRIGGRRVNELEPKDRDIAMVFQNYALYPHMSVYDNMAYGLRNLDTPRPQIDRRVKDAARILGLAELLERKPRQLSGGQRQRVAMGRAIVREPAVFLFDEPLSNLDAKLRVAMRHELKQLQDRLGTTGIYVTHDQVEAMTLGDRLIVLNGGRVEQIAKPLEIYARPASLFVAGFIGSPAMNMLDARIAADGAMVELGDARLPLPNGARQPAGRPVIVGLRPEHLQPDPAGSAPLRVRIQWREALGADTVLHGGLAHGAGLSVRVPGTFDAAIGDVLALTLPAAQLHLFDPATGRRLDDAVG